MSIWQWTKNWESELLSRAPDTQAYTIDNDDHDQDQDQDETSAVNPKDALNYLQQIQKSNLGDMKLFDILEQAMNLIQYKKDCNRTNIKN